MEKFEKFLKYAGAVSAVTALISLTITLISIKNNSDAARLKEWQEVAVFQIIENAGNSGISFDDLRDAYLNDAQVHEEFNIPKRDLQVPALKRVLLNLTSRNAMIINSQGNYTVFLQHDMMPNRIPVSIKRKMELEPVLDIIIGIVRDNEGKLDSDMVFIETSKKVPEVKITHDEITSMVSFLITKNGLKIDITGKLWTILGENNSKKQPSKKEIDK